MKANIKTKKLMKSFMCIMIVFMMLIGNFIVPIQIMAEEMQSNAEISAEEETNAEETGNQGISVFAEKSTDEIKPATGNIEIKTDNDNHHINNFQMEFVSGATKDENNNLVWTPENSSEGHEFTFRVNFSTSGSFEFPPEAIQITIPKSILRNREKQPDDKFIMSLPSKDEYNGKTTLAYVEKGDYLVIYNPVEVPAGMNGYFEIVYATKSKTFEYIDYDVNSTNLVKDGGTASDPFKAIITIKSGDDTLAQVSNEEKLFINTTAKITSTQKRYPTLYRTWQSSWQENEPADKDNYYYLVWEICTNIASPTQRYNFSLDDYVTDLTEGTTGTDYELVGYKLSGEQYYSNKHTRENINSEGLRYDYVLTRHKKSTYSNIKYKLKNTETATVDPIDQVDADTQATSSNIFEWDPSFTPPVGHFNLFKYGNNNWHNKFGYHWDYANYELETLQTKKVEKLEGFKYYTETIGYAYPWTIEDGKSSDDWTAYGKNPVTYITEDDTLYLENDTNPVNYNDYYLDYLTFEIKNKDVEYDEFYKKFNEIEPNYGDNEIITFYAKFGNENTWEKVGTVNLKTKQADNNSNNVSEITNGKIVFKEGVHCTGWKFETSNTHYYTHIGVYPYFVITNSSYVESKIENKEFIRLQNNVRTEIRDVKYETTEKPVFEKETFAIDYARVTYYDSKITKRVSAASNDVANREYDITWVVNAWEKVTSGKGNAEYVRQSSGTFYDLIPHGGTIDVNSIQIKTEEGFLEENEFTYDVISNYNNSGRTMLVVYVNKQAQYYTVFYNTVHSWEGIKDFGRDVLNPVAYETGNESIAKGYADNGGNLSEENKSIFVDLDKSTDAEKFIYAQEKYNINALTAAVAGLDKKVKNSKETEYVYNTVVEPSGSYSYQLRYQNTFMNTAKDLVFFDSLENFEVVNSKEGTKKTSAWRGTLEKIDLTQLKAKGIDAKIYISTKENLKLEDNNDLTDTNVWKQVDENADLSSAKAFAIDMKENTEGNEFILKSGDSVIAIVHMRAPAEAYEGMDENPYTYNNVYIHDILIDELGGMNEYFIHQDYTTVKYHIVADVPFKKVNAKNNEEGIKGITFRLYGTSKYGLEVDSYKTTDKDGYVNFKEIEVGEYVLQEYEGNVDWVEDHTEHRVRITEQKEVYIDQTKIENKDTFKIENQPRAHTDVTIYKRDFVKKAIAVSDAKFKLYGTSKYGNEILMFAISDDSGILIFENLEYGTYDLVEIELPEVTEAENGVKEGYILGEDKYKVVVDENSNYDVLIQENGEGEYKSVYNVGNYNIYNEPLHMVEFYKRDAYQKTINIPGAEFKLFGVSDYGNSYSEEATSQNNGLVQFSGLEPGEYLLQETFVPEITGEDENPISYMLDDTKYIVKVEKDGNVTINGIEKNEYGNYIFYNERKKGQITIIKKWVGDESQDREEPVIKISTEAPVEASAPIFRSNYSNSDGPLYYVDENYKNIVTSFARTNEDLTEAQVKAKGAVRIDNKYDDETAKYKIYSWIDDDGSCWWWSNSDVAILTNNSNALFKELGVVTKIDTTGINTKNVTDMNKMFYNCNNLTTLNISGLDTRNVTDMSYMFYNCNNLTSIDLSNFDTSNVTNMTYMFYNCKNLTTLDVSKFDTSSVTNMSYMFYNCNNVTTLDVSKFDTRNVTNMSNMFAVCRNLTSIDVSKFDTSNVTKMGGMFGNCNNLTSIDVSNFDTRNVTIMSNMFSECKKLTSIDVSKFDTRNVIDFASMFATCNNLTSIDVSNFDTSNATSMIYMFSGCSQLTSIDVSKFNTSKVKNIYAMFYGCNNLTSIDVSNFDTSNATSMFRMFESCSQLTSIDVSKFDTSNVTDMSFMFYNCSKLTSIDVSKFNTSNVTNFAQMFAKCSQLTSIDVSNFDTSNVTTMGFMFSGCRQLTSLNVSNFVTSKVTVMDSMFLNCKLLTSIDVSNFDTSNVSNMKSMFGGCNSLNTIYASSYFSTENVTKSDEMFAGSTALVGGKGTGYSSDKIDATYACIDNDEHEGYFTYREPTRDMSTPATQSLAMGGAQSFDTSAFMLSNVEYDENASMNSYVVSSENIESRDATVPSGIEYTTEADSDKWEKNDNTWTYTFDVDDPYATWYVWEEELQGYESNYTKFYPGVVENQKATIINRKVNNTPQTGEEPTVGLGSLEITKIVKRTTDSGEEVVTDDNTEFTFTVKLTAKKGQESLISGTKVFGNYIFKDGVAKIKLKAGETAIISDLLSGMTYKITEDEVDGYEISENKNGEISIGNTNIEIVNYKNKVETPVEIPEEQKVSFTVAKKVTGNYEVSGSYKFEIVLDNLRPKTEYSLSNGTKFTSDSIGSASVGVMLNNEESVTVQNIPVGSKYKVYEYAGDYISSYAITDKNNKGLISNSSKSNKKSNVGLSTNTETADAGENITITFTNEKKLTQNLKIAKETSDDDKNSYAFKLEIGNMKERESFNTSVGKITANSGGKAEITIYLTGGEIAELYDVPVGTTYKITEQASNSIASYTITDGNGNNKIVKATNANTKSKKELSTEVETVNEGEEVTVTFINDVVRNQETGEPEKDAVSVSLGATKKVLGIDGELLENYNEIFKIQLTAENEANPMPEKTEVQIKGNGTASFGEITFENVGTYTYNVVEIAGTTEELKYDNSVYTITYEVTNPNGLLEVEKTVKKNGFNADVVEFINKIVKVEVPIEKVDENKEALEGAILQLQDDKGNVIKEWTTGKQALEIKLPDGTYKLREVTAPAGYVKSADIDFIINNKGQIVINDKIVSAVIMQDDYTKVQIKKTDIATGKDVIGAKLQILNKNGEVVNAYDSEGKEKVKLEWVTEAEVDKEGNIVKDSDGFAIAKKVTFTKLPVGKYILKEIQAPTESGYVHVKDIEFEITETDKIKQVEMQDDYTKVQIKKTDIATGKDVIGAKLQVLNENGEIVEAYDSEGKEKVKLEWVTEPAKDENGNIVLDEKGDKVAKKVTFTKLAIGKYTLREIQAPTESGYVHVKDIEFEITETDKIKQVEMKDDYTKVSIKKTDITTGKDVIGAKLQVLDENNEIVEAYDSEGKEKVKLEWITEPAKDKNGNIVVDEEGNDVAKIVTFTKLPVGKYTLKEAEAPIENGYVYAENISFEVVETGDIQLVGMEDDYTKVKFNKLDEKGKFVVGATLAVKDLSGNTVIEWETLNESYIANKKLIPGKKYILEEIKAPDGYEIAENIEFTVSEYGLEDVVKMVDKKKVEKFEVKGDSDEELSIPKTGQFIYIYIIIGLIILGLIFLLLLFKRRKKDTEDEEIKK